ncbi:hypothetical protein Acid345_1219 [Candidatus Koribacter versatilis Ellin345]|uniref:Lipoprotein n=1 Tax=Koribacter versatilis (strain Ellin345) TaxID=204669 RepID=Q1ISC9_KORVE|nr:hypothetical protein [Candidatus Koribacter versatilis]ABF40221.1 hypothetical protein Acid345_1219 [Candidatus Koribacter versatilis Ellin345]
MRRFFTASYTGLAVIVLFTAFWSGCGGSSSSTTVNQITHFTFSPAIISLEQGQVLQIAAAPLNSDGNVVAATVTYTSSDTANADISPGGLLCAGTWGGDKTYTICHPGTQVGQYTITATANDAAASSATATAYVHYHVDAVFIQAPSATCTSAGKTNGVSAVACSLKSHSGGSCSATSSLCPTTMCDVSKDVGTFNFGALDSTVATIATDGTLTGGIPGITKIYAAVVSGTTTTTSTAVPYTTCLVDSISLHVATKTDTSFAVAKSATASLAADVLDTEGNTVTPGLTYNSLAAATGTVASSTGTATYTGKAPGYGAVVASCTPPSCNKNASAVFSNVVTATVQNSATDTGVTANETNVYVTGVGAQQMYPVDTTNHTLGTVMSLPYGPNSIGISNDGTRIFLGSDKAGMVVNTASNSVQALSFPGKVLAVSPSNNFVLFANTALGVGAVNIMSVTSLTVANPGGFEIPNVSAASFTPDGNTVYFTDGASLYRYRVVGDSGSTPTALTLTSGGNPLPGTANDLTTSANGTVLFTATTPRIVANETCNAFVGGSYVTAFDPLGGQNFTAPSALAQLPNGTGILAVDGADLDTVTITSPNPLTSPFSGCPATGFATAPGTISLSALGGATVDKLVVSNSGKYAAVLANNGKVGIVDLTKGTMTVVALVNKGTGTLTDVFSGDWMLDDSGVWVTASDSYLHFVDVTQLKDTSQTQVQIQGPPSSGGGVNYVAPNLVVVQRK